MSAVEAPPKTKQDVQAVDYDWRKQWYPVGYNTDITSGPRPFPVSVFDEPIVLFRDKQGELRAVQDLCPHRAAKLSEGQVENGNIECLYHGWQFEGKHGSCVKIPQLPADSTIPKAACLRTYPVAVREGIVWVWMGERPWDDGAKDIKPVPVTADDLDKSKEVTFTYQFVIDLEYDHSYLLENLLDPAHVPISHHATEGGGDKKNAKPLDFTVGPLTPTGFEASLASFYKKPAQYSFEAPCIIRVRNEVTKKDGTPGMVFGAALQCMPLGKGRSRLLFVTYGLRAPWILGLMYRLKPKFLRHLNSCKVLEQDINMITSQEDHVARTGKSLEEAFLPLKTSDGLVLAYRKWLDKFGAGMPFYQGWKTAKDASELSAFEDTRRADHRSKTSRYWRHVSISQCTARALRNVVAAKKAGFSLAAAFATAVAILARVAPASPWYLPATVGSVLSLIIGASSKKLEGHFYNNFKRHPLVN